MDDGLFITLICVLGGGFVIILNEMNQKIQLILLGAFAFIVGVFLYMSVKG